MSSPRAVGTLLAVLALTLAVIAVAVRARPLTNNVALLVAAASPYAVVAAAVGLALSLLCRRVVISVVAVVIVAANVALQVPWYYLGRPLAVGDHLGARVLSSNLRLGQVGIGRWRRRGR